jgi:glycosyltransferase involved in cell wall biosynthesis
MNKPLCIISCPIDVYSGYSQRARDIVKSLIQLKGEEWDIKILSQRWGNCPSGFLKDNEEWSFLLPYVLESNTLNQQPDFFFQITVPNEFQKVGKYSVGITAGIESTICDPSWIEGCNRMDEVWVSSNHAKQVFEQSKFEKRDKNTNQLVGTIELQKNIKVLFEGCDTMVYNPSPNSNFDLSEVQESFNFLFIGHFMNGALGHDRKNVGMMIKVFLETFKNKQNPPGLILKTSMATSSNMDRDEILKRIDSIRKTVKGKLPNIYLIHGNLSDKQINDIYNNPKVKAMFNLTRGEGFGRPLLEFSLMKKPLITTGWSGHTDFLKPEFSILLPGKLENIHESAATPNMLLKEAQWFTVDYVKAGEALLAVFNNYKEWQEKAVRQSYYSKTNFSFDKMNELLNKYLENFPKMIQQVNLILPKLTPKKLELPN